MSTLERRLQLLLSTAQYSRVAEVARGSGRSVNAVVRAALDAYLPDAPERHRGVLDFLSLSTLPTPGRELTPTELAAELDGAIDAHTDRDHRASASA